MRTVFNFLFAIGVAGVITSCGSSKKIIQKPVVYNEERKELSIEYMNERYGIESSDATIDPKMIVLHWTYIEDFEYSFAAFNNPKLPDHRPEIKDASALNVSAHFLVDRNGKIYQLLPETTMARHVIGLNHVAIGIENVGGTEATPLTAKQAQANIWLVNYLSKKYNIEYLIGHSEYTNFEGHKFWLEKDDGYRTVKTDPGDEFLMNVREATKHLNFKPVPQK